MKRIDFEKKSSGIINRYISMLSVLNKDNVSDVMNQGAEPVGYEYFKITEISKLWELQERPLWDILTEVFVSLHSLGVNVSTVFSCDGEKTSVYVGCKSQYLEIVNKAYSAALPQIQFVKKPKDNKDKIFKGAEVLCEQQWADGGFLKGNPTGSDNFTFSNQIEKVIRGMQNKKWQISVFATPVKKTETIAKQHMWLTLATECAQLSEVTYTDNDTIESTTYKKSYFHSEQYSKKIQGFVEKLEESITVGEWKTTINFCTTGYEDSRLLGGLLSATYMGEASTPESVHPVYYTRGLFFIADNVYDFTHKEFCEYPYPVYGNFLSSRELAVYCAPPVTDVAGVSVKDYVSFDVNRAVTGDTCIGNILENGQVSKNEYAVDINELNRHTLVIGLTGSGKTNTVKSLVCNSAKNGKNKPFMIIEPAKKEYWELYKLGFDNLRIYSIGSNELYSSRLCINPFERVSYKDEHGSIKAVSIQTHIDFVFSAFKASFIMYTPMPYVLEKAIYAIYEDCGWDIDNNLNKNGKDIYPTIEDLYFKIPQIVTEMGYDTKMRKDLIGSLQARINSLRIGSKGSALNVAESFPMEHLLEGNTIIEIEDIGDDDVKAFIISLLLIRMLEYRRQQSDCQQGLRHLLFIEEAHRLLKNVQSGTGENADPRGAAVEFFCNMLAEMRSKGQGFVVADQIPTKLAPDLIKNTNLKIVHRTVDEEDRLLMGGAMNMTEEQKEALSTLKQGVAAVYSEGDTRPKLVKPLYANEFMLDEREALSRQDVLYRTRVNGINYKLNKGYEPLTDKKSPICRACKNYCESKPEDILSVLSNQSDFIRFARSINPLVVKTCKVKNIDNSIDDFIKSKPQLMQKDGVKVKNCLMVCLLEQWDLNSKDKKLKGEIERIYSNTVIKEMKGEL